MLSLTALAGFGVGQSSVQNVSFVTSATNTGTTTAGLSVVAPAGIIAGDLLVWVIYARGTTISASGPTGFTGLLGTISTGGGFGLSAGRIANGTESGTTISPAATGGTFTNTDVVLLVFRGDNPITQLGLGTPNGASSATLAPTTFNVSPGAFVAPTAIFVYWGGSGAVTTRGMSPAKDGEIATASNRLFVGWKFYNVGSTPVTNSVSSSDNGNDNLTVGNFVAFA